MNEEERKDKGIFGQLPGFIKRYVCEACGIECHVWVANSRKSLPCPGRCPYKANDGNKDFKPNWRLLLDKLRDDVKESMKWQ